VQKAEAKGRVIVIAVKMVFNVFGCGRFFVLDCLVGPFHEA